MLLLIQTGATGFASAAIFVILGSMVSHLPLHEWGVSRAEATLLQSAIFLGVTFGTLIGGVFADRYGRRAAVLLSYMLLSMSVALLVLAPGYKVMVLGCLTFGLVGGFSLPAVNALLVENSPQRRRGELVCLSSLLWFLGELYGAGCVWFLGQTKLVFLGSSETGFQWRACFFMGFLPAVPVVIYAFCSLRESPRFLVSQGRVTEAYECLVAIATKNRVEIPILPARDQESQAEESAREAPGWGQTLKNLELLTRWPVNISTVVLMTLCLVCNFAYFGLIFALPQILQDQKGTVGIGGPSAQVFIVTLFKIPGIIVAFLLLRSPKVGHKPCLMVLLASSAFCAWSYPQLVSVGAMKAAFSSACFLKLTTSAAFIILYVFVLEVYPTQIRSTGMAICSMVGRLGAVISPMVHSYAVAYAGNYAYFMTIAFSAIIASGAAVLMPYDTKGKPLAEGGESSESCHLLAGKKG